MNWSGEPGNLVSVGLRGTYTIQSLIGGTHVLQGVGHDDIPMRTLPWLGKVFNHLRDAQTYAGEIDTSGPVEAQAGAG